MQVSKLRLYLDKLAILKI